MIKVSVVIPVYNGEKHLKECMDSICGQSLQDIEIICVDDGSTDDSWRILNSYRDSDSRIQLYQQDHKHAGVARNVGKSYATGEYLAFWDCDDFFDLRALEKLYNKAKRVDADVCVCGGNQYWESKGKSYPFPAYLNMKKVPKEVTFNRYTNLEHYLDFTSAAVWNKLFRRQYIKKQGLDFQSIRNGNDVYFTENALGLADRITVLDERLVNYRVNQNSGLTYSHDKDPLAPIQAWIDTAENLEKYDGFGEKTFANRALSNILYLLSNLQVWRTFSQAVEMLKDGGLMKMHIMPKEEGYYYAVWEGECVQHLWNDSPEELSVFLARSRYMQQRESSAELRNTRGKVSDLQKSITVQKEKNANLQEKERALREKNIARKERIAVLKDKNCELKKKNKMLEENLERIKHSWSFKLGKTIMWLPRHIKKFFVGVN